MVSKNKILATFDMFFIGYGKDKYIYLYIYQLYYFIYITIIY